MKNKLYLVGMLGMVLALGFLTIGCDDGSTEFNDNTTEKNDNGTGTDSNEDETFITAPTYVVATALSASSIQVNYSGGSGASSYKVYYGTTSLLTSYAIGTSSGVVTVTGLSANTEYAFIVRAEKGSESTDSSVVFECTKTTSGSAGTVASTVKRSRAKTIRSASTSRGGKQSTSKTKPVYVYNFEGNDLITDPGFDEYLSYMDSLAESYNVSIYVTGSFRTYGATVSNPVVDPDTKNSNHFVGHAVDINIRYPAFTGRLYNSTDLSNYTTLPNAVKEFIAGCKINGLRWGGDFTTPDVVHFDDNLWLRSKTSYNKLFKTYQGVAHSE